MDMTKDQLTQNIAARTEEVAGYQTNIDNYTRMVAKITGAWCVSTEPLRGMDTQAMAAQRVTDDVLTKAADLNFRDKLLASIRAERIEQRKAMLVLEVLQDQLNEVQP